MARGRAVQVVGARPGLLLQRLEVLSQASLQPDLVLGVSVLGAEELQLQGLDPESELGEWSPRTGYTPRADMPPLRRFLRIGIVEVGQLQLRAASCELRAACRPGRGKKRRLACWSLASPTWPSPLLMLCRVRPAAI